MPLDGTLKDPTVPVSALHLQLGHQINTHLMRNQSEKEGGHRGATSSVVAQREVILWLEESGRFPGGGSINNRS